MIQELVEMLNYLAYVHEVLEAKRLFLEQPEDVQDIVLKRMSNEWKALILK